MGFLLTRRWHALRAAHSFAFRKSPGSPYRCSLCSQCIMATREKVFNLFTLRSRGFQKHKAVYVFEIPFKSHGRAMGFEPTIPRSTTLCFWPLSYARHYATILSYPQPLDKINTDAMLAPMNEGQRKLFAKGSIDMANIVAGALVFGQLVSSQEFNRKTFAVGILIAIVFYFGAYLFSNERKVSE